MPPKDYWDYKTKFFRSSWPDDFTKENKHLAKKYIEQNVDLIDTDLQKFMDDCPRSCQLEVYEMLQKAGIDMKDYVIRDSLKQWVTYVYDANQYYTIKYKQQMDEHIDNMITWKKDWLQNAIVLDTIPAIEEA